MTVTSTPIYSLANVDLTGKIFLAFPNPAKQSVTFVFHPDHAADAKVNIYNLMGEKVGSASRRLAAGRGQVLVWPCGQVAPGMYIADVWLEGKKIGQSKLAIAR
jgi:hypothetical protein